MKPILFNTEMVRAILDGQKTQTRRVVKFPEGMTGRLPPSGANDYLYYPCGIKRPMYQKGDVLYVRETWAENPFLWEGARYIYRASHHPVDAAEQKWRPSIHMPKEAARIFLRVTDVRVERLQDMTETDAEEEGYAGCPAEHIRYFPEGGAEPCFNLGDCPFQFWYCLHSLPEGFGRDIWDKTIKPADRDRYGWAANPWVWVVSFERYYPADPEGGIVDA